MAQDTRPGAALDFRRNLVPIYLQLVTIFRRFVVTGEWAVGEQIPTVEDLAARFGVACATVRHALDLLEREGLFSRHRRRGTFVIARPEPQPLHDIPTDWPNLVRAMDGIDVVLLDRRVGAEPPSPFHAADGDRLAPRYDRLTKLYRQGTAPLLVEVAHIEARLARRIGADRIGRQATFPLLDAEKSLRLGRVDQTVQVGVAEGETARILKVPLHAPAAIAHYTVRDATGMVVSESEEVFRGDKVRVTERLEI